MLTGDRLLLKTPLNSHTGYGKDGMQLAVALAEAGSEVHLEPRNVGVPLTPEVAAMLTIPRPNRFEIALQHEYPGGIDFPERIRQFAPLVVAWTMYEFLGFGSDTEQIHNLEERLKPYDLLLAYDSVTKSAFSEYMDESKIKILQGGYDSHFWTLKDEEHEYRRWDDTFIFVMNGTMNMRKNPFAAIRAFTMLKDEYGDQFDAQLILKTTSRTLHPAMMDHNPGLKIIYDFWNEAQIKSLYLASNCLLAPSWGEGKNLPALESQTTGLPVIVSDFGGHKQWASDEWAYLVGGTIEEHSPGQGSMRVDEEKLAETMWYVYNNRTEARLKGEKASQIIPSMCDWSVVVERLKNILSHL